MCAYISTHSLLSRPWSSSASIDVYLPVIHMIVSSVHWHLLPCVISVLQRLSVSDQYGRHQRLLDVCLSLIKMDVIKKMWIFSTCLQYQLSSPESTSLISSSHNRHSHCYQICSTTARPCKNRLSNLWLAPSANLSCIFHESIPPSWSCITESFFLLTCCLSPSIFKCWPF